MYRVKSNEQITKEEDNELRELQERIEQVMYKLNALQDRHIKETGKKHVMNVYLCTPKHLQERNKGIKELNRL